MPVQIALVGARGRTGRAIAEAAPECDGAVAFALGRNDDLDQAVQRCDVVMDFSSHDVTAEVIRHAVRHGKPLVIGTTGHTADEKQLLQKEAGCIPTVWSGNYSVGVNLLFALTREACAVLGTDCDAEVIEMHHRFKKDAPSGTAARILEIILEQRKQAADAVRHGRSGIIGERKRTEVGVHALRGGDVVGDHTIVFAGLGERLELAHRASNRAIFARGALRAAGWITSRPPGVYDMQDVLGLR